MKQKKYRIYVLGSIPPDLKERIIAAHAAGILKGRRKGIPVHTQAMNDQNADVLQSSIKGLGRGKG